MRSTELNHSNLITEHLLGNRDILYRQQAMISSGKSFTSRSDDVNAAAKVADLTQTRAINEQYIDNLKSYQHLEQFTQAGIDHALSNVQRVREILITATDGSKTTADREAMAKEIDEIIEDMVALANRKSADTYIFGGTKSDTLPVTVTRDSEGLITGVTYQNASARTGDGGPGMSIEYGIPASGGNGLFNDTNTDGTDILANLISLRDELLVGDPPSETAFTSIDDSLQQIVGHSVQNGLRQNRLESLIDHVGRTNEADISQLARVGELDIAKAATDLSRMQVVYQASMQMAAQLNKLSIMNYI